MSRHEDVIRLARDVADKDKVDPVHGDPPFVVLTPEELTRFYDAAFKAGAEAEREAIMHECVPGGNFCDPQQICDSIRARGTVKESLTVKPEHHVPDCLRREVERGNRAGGVG